MGVRTRTPWSLQDIILSTRSVQKQVVDSLLAQISVGIPSAKIINLTASKITAGTITAENIRIEGTSEAGTDAIILETSGTKAVIKSDNFVTGSAGFIVRTDGSAEFDDVIIRGDIEATSLGGIMTMTTGGVFRTAASGQRIEIIEAFGDQIKLFSGGSNETAPGFILISAIGGDPQLHIANGNLAGQVAGNLLFNSNGDTSLQTSSASGTELTLRAGGTEHMRLVNSQVQHIAGTASLPGMAFLLNTNLGFYRTNNKINISTDGVNRGDWSSAGLFINVSGSATTPALRLNDINTGFYLVASDRIGVTTNGGFAWEFTSNGSGTNVVGGSGSASNSTPRTYIGAPGSLNIFTRSAGQTIVAGRSTNDGGVIDFRKNTTQVGTISVTSTNTAYNTSSDRRLKKDITDLVDALGIIRRLRPRSYRWKVNDEPNVSLIAQEAVRVFPQAVHRPDTRSEPWGIDNSVIVPVLIKAVQELEQKLDEAFNLIAVLEAA